MPVMVQIRGECQVASLGQADAMVEDIHSVRVRLEPGDLVH